MEKILAGRYRVIGNLGQGGFGYTYVAEDTQLPGYPQCVVKHLKPDSRDAAFLTTARRLFNTEAETLEKLGSHDQIPRLLAYFEENKEFYLVQELISGNPISAELQKGVRWTENQVFHLLIEVLSVLKFVHSYGVIHRDIKPDNLIRRHQDNKLVLVDFGAVKQIRTNLNTELGSVNFTISIGTSGYVPTEQLKGKPRFNSDIYSLGIVAIQALTGLLPDELKEEEEDGEILWRNEAQVRAELAEVLEKMVRYHFKDRYQSSTEVLEILRQLNFYDSTQTISPPRVTQSSVYTPTAIGQEIPPSGFFGTGLLSKSSFFGEESRRYQNIDETLKFYVGHLDREYKSLSQQADTTFKLWLACVSLALLILLVVLVMTFMGMITQGVLTAASIGIVYFIQRIFQQREDYYRKQASIKNRHLEYGNHWLLVIQSIDAIEDSTERRKQQSRLVQVLAEKLRVSKPEE